MARMPSDPYNPVPTAAPQTGMPSDLLQVQANPNDFGAQIGQSIQKAGQTVDQLGNQAVDIAIQRQGMLNESAATDLNTQAMIKRGEILNKYKTMEGFDAVNNRESTIAALAAVRQDILKGVKNPAVARAFNMLDARQEGYSINEADSWGASQAKTAATNSANASLNLSVDQASDPSVALDPSRVSDALVNVRFNTARLMQLQGYGNWMKQTPDGNVVFDNSPEGEKARSVYQQQLNIALGKTYENIFKVIAFDPVHGNVQTAAKWLQDNKDNIPSATYAKISAQLAAPLLNAQARDGANDIFSQTEADRLAAIDTNISGKYTADQLADKFIQQESGNGATSKNLGQIQPATWQAFSKPGEDINNPKDNRAVTVRYLDYLNKKFNGDPERVAVAYFSGEKNVAPAGSPNAWINDTQDKNGKTVSSYVGDIVKRLNPAGYQSQADYYADHYEEISNKVLAKAALDHPDNPVYADSMLSHAQTKMNLIISQQRVQNYADTHSIAKYINENPISSSDQLLGGNVPSSVREAYINQLSDNPIGINNMVTKLIQSKSRGWAKTYGTDFWSQFQAVSNGKVANVSDLSSYIQPNMGEKSPITNTGFKALQNQMDLANDPANRDFLHSEMTFLQEAHNQIVGANFTQGNKNGAGEQRFNTFLLMTLPQIEAAKAQGVSAAKMFDPKSPEYIGSYMSAFIPDITKVSKEVYSTSQSNLSQAKASTSPINFKDKHDLYQAWKDGKITQKAAQDYAIKQGWGPAPQVPLPQ